MSNQVRWSIDLRWQKPTLPFGFYGMKEGVIFRKADDPNYEVDWDTFEGIDRHEKQREAVKDMLEVGQTRIVWVGATSHLQIPGPLCR